MALPQPLSTNRIRFEQLRDTLCHRRLSGARFGTQRPWLFQALNVPPQSRSFEQVQTGQQAPQFVVTGPARLTYLWAIQHRIQVSTSSSGSEDLPLIDVDAVTGKDGEGFHEFWFDRGTALKILARERTPNTQLNGWLMALGIPGVQTSSSQLPSDSFTVAGNKYRGFALSSLLAPVTISWDYGDPIFHEDVTLGNSVQFVFAPQDTGFDISKIESRPGVRREPDSVRVVEGPPGSTGSDMHEWDAVARKSYPTRPGIFFLEWNQEASATKVVVQVTTGFGEDTIPNRNPAATFVGPKRHYRHLSHPDMPAVDLDADAKDGTAFLSLKFTESDGALQEQAFNAQRPGRHVLLFSQAATGVTATGDRTRETLLVRVVETRRWNAVYDGVTDPDKIVQGAWTDAAGSSMLQAPVAP